jgi:hypothetical protein
MEKAETARMNWFLDWKYADGLHPDGRYRMPKSGERSFINALGRICLWFGSLLIAVLFFSQLFSLLFNHGAPIFPIFRATMIFALPVACLYLPFLIALRNTEGQRIGIILLGGTLIGPVSIGFWGLVLQMRGGDTQTIWHGDPLTGLGGFIAMLFALVVGFLTTCSYILVLKVTHRLRTH